MLKMIFSLLFFVVSERKKENISRVMFFTFL
jgi:hypothetical protein